MEGNDDLTCWSSAPARLSDGKTWLMRRSLLQAFSQQYPVTGGADDALPTARM
jgi:hypothetical protein